MINEKELRTLIKLWRDNAEFLQLVNNLNTTDDMASVYNGCARTLELYLQDSINEEQKDG